MRNSWTAGPSAPGFALRARLLALSGWQAAQVSGHAVGGTERSLLARDHCLQCALCGAVEGLWLYLPEGSGNVSQPRRSGEQHSTALPLCSCRKRLPQGLTSFSPNLCRDRHCKTTLLTSICLQGAGSSAASLSWPHATLQAGLRRPLKRRLAPADLPQAAPLAARQPRRLSTRLLPSRLLLQQQRHRLLQPGPVLQVGKESKMCAASCMCSPGAAGRFPLAFTRVSAHADRRCTPGEPLFGLRARRTTSNAGASTPDPSLNVDFSTPVR